MVLSLVLAFSCAQMPALPKVKVVTLSNGMRWVLLPRPNELRVSGVVMVDSGAVHERPGEAGVAHFLEHLAFGGTPIVGTRQEWRLEAPLLNEVLQLTELHAAAVAEKGARSGEAMALETRLVTAEREWEEQGDFRAFRRLFARSGIQHNATTSYDVTTYFGDVPAEQLHLWLAAEAQRFAAPVFRNFRTERDVVLQESIDRETPITGASNALWQLAFGGNRPWNLTGSPADVRSIRPSTVDAFYSRLSSPSNAVGALVGDFEVGQAVRWLHETFELIPARPTAAEVDLTPAPPGFRGVTGTEPWVLVGFQAPASTEASAPAHELAALMFELQGGPVAGLCDSLASSCLGIDVFEGPGLARTHLLGFAFDQRANGRAAETLERFFASLQRFTPDDAMLERARALAERRRATELQTSAGVARALAVDLMFTNDWKSALTTRYRDVSLEAVVKVFEDFTLERSWVVAQETP